MKKINFIMLIVLASTLLLQGCGSKPSTSREHIINVEMQGNTNKLFFSGTIQPIKTHVIPSPVDGVVVEMPFQYGEQVSEGKLLFKISSAKFLADYKAALLQYVKAKSDFNTGQTQLSESEFLHKNELISDDDFKMKQANFYASRLALVQAKDTLESLLNQLDIKNINLNTLSIADIDKITQAMHLQMTAENLRILAPTNGIILAPHKSDDDSKKIGKGDAVKQGDVIAMIGDMSGVSVRIKVNELTVNQLKPGQKIQITGIAFPEEILVGAITRVDRQGESSGGGMPTFAVEVNVPKLTQAQQRVIHAGMSADVEIDIDDKKQILVPFNALSEKNGESFVNTVDAKTGKKKMVAVKTGRTTVDSVAILSGINVGDKLVIPN